MGMSLSCHLLHTLHTGTTIVPIPTMSLLVTSLSKLMGDSTGFCLQEKVMEKDRPTAHIVEVKFKVDDKAHGLWLLRTFHQTDLPPSCCPSAFKE